MISQWHIDGVLAAVTLATSKMGPRISAERGGQIYKGLCRLLSTLIISHRKRLGGRHHLMILSLQGLLSCLFRPYGNNTSSDSDIVIPPWLQNRDSVLGESHAASFARLLTMICDPSVSAVTRKRKQGQEELNDATRKAKKTAGQYLQYLITTFCRCQLHGRLSPLMKTALNQGLFAVLNAMSQDTMRSVNASLDSAGRSIFKALYDDYRRFGRWEGA